MKKTATSILLAMTLMVAAAWAATTDKATSIPSQENASGLELFSPQGEVKKVRQVTARFAESMVPFGDPRQVDPFDIDCPESGNGRWADDRNWVYDFDHDLPAGVQCRFTARKELTSLAGHAIAAGEKREFTTGGPAVINSLPRDRRSMSTRSSFSDSTRRRNQKVFAVTPIARSMVSASRFRCASWRAKSASRYCKTGRNISPAGIGPFSGWATGRHHWFSASPIMAAMKQDSSGCATATSRHWSCSHVPARFPTKLR